MQLFRRWDPRLNPALRPHEWEKVIRRTRRILTVLGALLVGALIGFGIYVWYPFDRTRGLTPEQIAEGAGMVLLGSGGYRFEVDLTGEAADNLFPAMDLKGEYQKTPPLLHLAGSVKNGDAKVALEYYLEGSTLYIKHPTSSTWVMVKDAAQDELTSFFPDNLAAPLVSGVRKAEIVQREKLPGGQAVQLKLDLDPDVMLPHAQALHQDKAEYMLWVYTRNLRPARFTISVVPQSGAEQDRQTSFFAYALNLDFTHLSPMTVPPAVKQGAQAIDEPNKDRGEGPPRPPEQPPAGETGAGN
ncbi:MAG TPA: hypothetical protein VGK74_01140 [Symbiobacteriaceae bacterium]|jgi:hypothetical protein